MRVAELLSIDVEAQLRTICADQVHGPWQLPAELLRYAVALGASAAEVEGTGRGLLLRCPGTGSSREQLQRLAAALDPAASLDDRHQALLDLERTGALALLWAAGAQGMKIRIASRVRGSATVFELRPGRRPRVVVDAPDEVAGGFEVELEAPSLDVRRALAWVNTACRFAPIPVTVDGDGVAQGFVDNLGSVSLGSPVTGGIALTIRGDAPHLWLLRHGVLATRASLPDHPPFEAAVEMADLAPDNANPDELRRALEPHLPTLVDRAARLLVDALSDGVGEDPDRARRLATLVLRTASKGVRANEISNLEAFPTVDPTTGSRRYLSLTEIRARCAAGQELWSVPPETRLGTLPEDERTLLLLTDEQHGLLVDLLATPIQRPEPRSMWGRRTWSARRIGDAVRRAGALLPVAGVARAVPDNQLLDAERRLVRQLQRVATDREGRPLAVRMGTGIRRTRLRDGEILLPRHDPLVVAAVRLADAGDEWLFPAALALFGDRGSVSTDLRSRWRRMVLARPPSQSRVQHPESDV